MAKVSKDKLKALIKECLVEILNEGLGNLAVPKTQNFMSDSVFEDEIQPLPQLKKIMQRQPVQQKKTIADDRRMQESKNNIASKVTNVPILQEMLNDPATLAAARNMRSAMEAGGSAGAAPAMDLPGIPAEQIESLGDSSNWATIAFAQTRRPGMP